MELIIVRHGETEENLQGITQGQIPGKLSKKGIEQAKKLARELKGEKIDFIYSSDLKRAKDTAEKIFEYHQSKGINFDKRLRERFFGPFQGKKLGEQINFESLPEEVETDEDYMSRVENFVQEMNSKHKGKTILVVCHWGTKIAFLNIFNNSKNYELKKWGKIENASISKLKINKNGYEIKYYNYSEHL